MSENKLQKPKRSNDKYWTGTKNFDHIQYESDLEDYITELEEIAAANKPIEFYPHDLTFRQPLFSLIHGEHGLTLLESEMDDIINCVLKMVHAEPQKNK